MSNQRWIDEEFKRVEAARQMLKPRPVTLTQFPAWLDVILTAVEALHRLPVKGTPTERLHRALGVMVQEPVSIDVLEFAGASIIDGVPTLVIEVDAEKFDAAVHLALERFGRVAGLTFNLSARAWFWPGNFIRAEFLPHMPAEQVIEVERG